MTVNLSELDAGTELELTYDGSRGSRTITVYVADSDRSPCLVDSWEQDDVELRLGDTDAGRFLRLSFDVPEDSDEWDYAESWTNVRSMNSKSDRGRRLGRVLDLNVLDSEDERGVRVNDYRNATPGDVVQVNDRTGVVTDDSYGLRVEFDDGDTEPLRTTARRGVYYNDEDYNSVEVEFSPTGETVEPSDVESDLFEVLQDYGHGVDRGKVVAVELDGTRYELTYRHNADEEGIRFTGPNSVRDGNERLRLDPLGLTFNGTRVSVEDLTLVYGEETDEDEESEFETVDARETEVVDPSDLFSTHELTGTYVRSDGTRYLVADRERFRPFLVVTPEDKENAPDDSLSGKLSPGYFEERLREGEFTPLSTETTEVETDGGEPVLLTDGGQVSEFSDLYASAVDRFGEENVEDTTSKSYDLRNATAEEGVGKFEVDLSDEDVQEVRDELEQLGYEVYQKPDGRYSQGYDPETVVVVWAEGAELVSEDDEPEVRTDGGEGSVTPQFTLPTEHYYGRTVPGGPWHIFDDEERRSLCGVYNDEGVTHGSDRGLEKTDLPSDTCGSCVGHASYLELYEEETVEVDGKEVPKPLAGFYQDDLRGLFAVRPGSGRDSVILYDSCRRVGGRAAVEIANDEPQINDESDYPGVSPPRATFDQLVREYGLTYEVIGPNTYVYVPEEGGR